MMPVPFIETGGAMPDHLERRVPADNIARFYHLEIQQTLFGDWAVRL